MSLHAEHTGDSLSRRIREIVPNSLDLFATSPDNVLSLPRGVLLSGTVSNGDNSRVSLHLVRSRKGQIELEPVHRGQERDGEAYTSRWIADNRRRQEGRFSYVGRDSFNTMRNYPSAKTAGGLVLINTVESGPLHYVAEGPVAPTIAHIASFADDKDALTDQLMAYGDAAGVFEDSPNTEFLYGQHAEQVASDIFPQGRVSYFLGRFGLSRQT